MCQQPPGYRLPPATLRALGELERKMNPYPSARQLWEKAFTEADRGQLGDDFGAAYAQHGSCGMWIALKHVSPLKGLIDSAHAAGFLSDVDRRWLLREIGESEDIQEDRGSLCWDRETHELRLGGRIIRRVRSLSVAVNVAAVLDAFEEADWPRLIETPGSIDTSLSSERVHETIRTLNEGLGVIRFHVDEGGQRIFWDRP